MARYVTPHVKVRGVIKKGRVELLDDVEIPDGTLLDISVIETPEETSLKTAKRKRDDHPERPLRFGFAGKKLRTSDPLELLQQLPKGDVSTVRFEDYRATCHVLLHEWQCELAEYTLGLHPPPENIAKLFRRGLRQRRRLELAPGSSSANELATRVRELSDQVEVLSEDGMSLWFTALTLITGDTAVVADAMSELFEFAPRVHAENACNDTSPTRRHELESEGHNLLKSDLRDILFRELRGAASRARKGLAGPEEAIKLLRRELSEIAKRLA
ncbi:MAG: hypothetical protein AAFX06_30550 [Planctomycetota bacterium]